MGNRLSIQRAEIVSALSHALDMTEGQVQGHGVRCAFIGWSIGRQIGLSNDVLGDLYYTLLLKDIGCSSTAARVCELYMTDDLSFKKGVRNLDDGLPQIMRFLVARTGADAGLMDRFRTLVKIFKEGGAIARELVDTRCQRGANIVRRMRFSESVAQGILDLDEHWDGGGRPMGTSGAEIHLFARIALLAQVVDIFHSSGGADAASTEIKKRSGRWFDPALVKAFDTLALDAGFWSTLQTPDLQDYVVSLAPDLGKEQVDDDYLDEIATAFAEVVDSKSPYTAGHSDRVTLFTDMIAQELGLSEERRRFLKRAALLHDLGKLGVSNQILDKPAKLDEAEWASMRQHPAQSYLILSRIKAFKELAQIAGDHHERLDGKGYPRGISGDQIALESRIITVADIFDALTADRPYRAAMPISKAFEIMSADIGTGIDGNCFAALQRALVRMENDAGHGQIAA
jgi:HD-GYP domain-containing protein (c-di-GMP phosphodiesterase class II)